MTALFLRLVNEICFDFRNAGSLKVLVSGFRLANGIRRELVLPYSYEAEYEAQAQDIFRQEFKTEKGRVAEQQVCSASLFAPKKNRMWKTTIQNMAPEHSKASPRAFSGASCG